MTLQEWKNYPKELVEAAIRAGVYQVIEKKEVKQWD